MATKRKVKVDIQYKSKTVPNKLVITNTLKGSSEAEIPQEKHLRSQYFHVVMNSLERLSQSDEELTGEDLQNMKTILVKLNSFLIHNRGVMNKKHRCVAWMIYCRMSYLLFLAEGGEYPHLDRKFLLSKDLLNSQDHPRTFDLEKLWRAINIFVDQFNNLRYNQKLETYVNTLFTASAAYTWKCEVDMSMYTNQVFTRMLPNGSFSINQTFILETERVFRDTWERMERYRAFGQIVFEESMGEKRIEAFQNWMVSVWSGVFRDFVERKFREEIYSAYVCVSERDRYLNEERDFTDPKPQNIVSKFRPHIIDQINKTTAGDDMLDEVVQRHNRRDLKETEGFIDLDYDTLCRSVVSHYFESVLAMQEDIAEYIFTMHSTYTAQEILKKSMSFPRIVQVLHEYGVVYMGATLVYPSMDSCFLAWLKTICEDRNHNGLMPDKLTNLLHIYDTVFPDCKDEVFRPMKVDDLQLEMPPGYESDGQTQSFF